MTKKIVSLLLAATMLLSLSIVLAGCSSDYKSAVIKICIPAGTTGEFVYQEDFIYSDEEISTNNDTLTLSIEDGFEGMKIVLEPIEHEEENAYEPMPITSETPVEVDVEKGAWFKIGIAMQNDTDEDIIVDVTVSDVIVRIE